MRTPRQQLYDNLYYGFESWLNNIFRNIKCDLASRHIKFDETLENNYRHSIRPYWAQFGVKFRRSWARHMYLISGCLEPRYIPRVLWFGHIIPHFNDMTYERQLQDKNLHNLVFPTTKRPHTIFKYMKGVYCNDDFSPITEEEALSRCSQESAYIIKPTTDTCEGHGIRAVREPLDRDALADLLKPYTTDSFIVQRFLTQHADLSQFNSSTINTIRIVTLVFNNQAHILSSILRIGAPGNCVDNVSQGGYQCTIRPDGTLEKLAYTNKSGKASFVEQTHTGARFENFHIPVWEKVVDTAKTLALQLPYMRLIGWDFSISEDGDIVLIEYNVFPEQNESTCGPSFGDLTEDVLAEVFNRKKT